MSDGTINFPERATPPTTPAAGRMKFWVDETKKVPFYTDDNGLSKSIAAPPAPIRLAYPLGTDTASATYETLGLFGYDGSDELGVPTAIKALVNITGATSGSIRIFDETNSLVIAELTGFTETDPTIKDLGAISNVPTSPAVWSIQLLRVGTGGDSASVHSVAIKF